MKAKLGNEFDAFVAALIETPPVSIRVNPLKPRESFPGSEPIPWCEFGSYLPERPSFVWDPLYHAGTYYAQEASSMLFANAIDFSKDLKVLDLCAAPGGKSSLILSKLSPGSMLVSNEMVGKRVNVLHENLAKWGSINSVVTCNKVSDFLPYAGLFDVVLVDAPCSGEGMFRKDAEAVAQWSDGLVEQCSAIQKEILSVAIKMLSQNGLLIYSTCTFEERENEQNLQWLNVRFNGILESVKIPINPTWGIYRQLIDFEDMSGEGWYCYPHRVKGEGLFLSALKLKHAAPTKGLALPKTGLPSLNRKELEVIKPFVDFDSQAVMAVHFKDEVHIIPSVSHAEMSVLSQKLYLRKLGIKVGKIIRDTFIPDPELALSIYVSKNVPRAELELAEALDFLQKKEIKVKPNTAKGWILLTYRGIGLGWAKNLGNRVNTHYPAEWKIRKAPTAEYLEGR
jgi:16S rRNA C967 or C1407 C5-methylase (RsmB/RsmF family)/NOL1/NOP2/fmu family ribosome biogenesis protein